MADFFSLDHARASAGLRSAKRTRSSVDSSSDLARSVRSKDPQYSAGILSLCHHLETCVAVVPERSDAKASREPQSSMMLRNEVRSSIGKNIGQPVLKRKAFLSLDRDNSVGHDVLMPKSGPEAEYKQAFIQRVKEARETRDLKQWEIAELLEAGMAQDKYKQYETRSLLPHHLIGRFCIICRVDPEWLVTGKGKKIVKTAQPEPAKPAIQKKPGNKVA